MPKLLYFFPHPATSSHSSKVHQPHLIYFNLGSSGCFNKQEFVWAWLDSLNCTLIHQLWMTGTSQLYSTVPEQVTIVKIKKLEFRLCIVLGYYQRKHSHENTKAGSSKKVHSVVPALCQLQSSLRTVSHQ